MKETIMNLQLEGKRALITGSSSGIGESIAKTLAREGVVVAIHGRNETEAHRVAREIAKAGGKAIVALGDLSKDDEAKSVAEKVVQALGQVDIVINNAGGFEMLPWLETSPQKWADMYNHDVISMVRIVQNLAPQMKRLGWGRFIQVASVAATNPWPIGPDYMAAKAAIINLSVSLAKELAHSGITSNTISPGPILTAGFEKFFREIAKEKGWGKDWDEIEKQAVKNMLPNPTGRVGRVEEVANLTAFVASPLSGYINGANLRVDGGYVPTIN
jgi:3-oxoacyl-[acyl-carrier protein] reductase